MRKGLIMRSTGSWYDVLDEETDEHFRGRLRGKLKLKLQKVTNPVAVGDYVEFEIEDKTENTVAIGSILPRHNFIARKAVQKSRHRHIIAANLDLAMLVVTLAMPRTSTGFIDRFLVSAQSFDLQTVLVFNKLDLYDQEAEQILDEYIELYESIGYPCLKISALENNNISAVQEVLQGKKTLIAGHSGVGKSTLMNQLNPALNLATREVSSFANKGVHTTTFAEMFEIMPKTYVIDTPGIKELGLVDIEQDALPDYFPEIRQVAKNCKYYNCTHIHEPNCAVEQAVREGKIWISRYKNYLSMFHGEDNRR